MDASPSTPRPRSTRDRPAKAPLSEDAIVAAGLEILRRSGLEAVTMRAVAQALDTGPASLYVYVGNRAELGGLLFDRVFASIDRPAPDPDRWREQLVQLCLDMLDVLEAHPGLAALALGNAPIGPHSLDVLEGIFALLLAGGADPPRAAWTADTLFLIIAGSAVETRARADAAKPGFDQGVGVLGPLDPERHPTVAKYAELLVGGNGRDRFLFSIETVLDGLLAGGTPTRVPSV
jgi:AcrR family transcriptional regulator